MRYLSPYQERLFVKSYLQSVVVWARDNPIIAELKASDNVVVVAFENFLMVHTWPRSPIAFNSVLPHETKLQEKQSRNNKGT